MARGTAQKMLLNKLRRNVNNANGDPSGTTMVEEVATIPVVTDRKLVSVGQGMYNPPFKAQIQVNMIKQYYTYVVNTGVFAASNAGAILGAGINESLPSFLFSNSDFASGFAKLRGQFPLSSWTYEAPFVFGKTWPGI